MNKTNLILLSLLALIPPSALADEDFGEDGSAEVVETSTFSPQKEEQYEAALEAARQRGDPAVAQELQERVRQQTQNLAAPIDLALSDLPFSLLSVELDADRDGLSATDEAQLQTDPNKIDSDNDGYPDGVEVVRGYNPLRASPGDKISYLAPAVASSSAYQITGVRLEQKKEQSLLIVTGLAPSSALVAILVFPDSKFWIARADSTGRFIYSSADTLSVGEHKIYGVAVSADGQVREAGQPVTVRREADRIYILQPEPAASFSTVVARRSGWFIPVVVGAAAGLAVLVLLVIYLIWRQKRIKII